MGKVELLKSIVGNLIRTFSGEIRSTGKIDYDEVLKNHGALMNAYGSVRKRVSKTPEQIFYRSLFVESHIYKQLQSLKKIYLTEIAILNNTDNNSTKSALNKIVEDIEKFSKSLFHFPIITWKTILPLIPVLVAVLVAVYQFQPFFFKISSQSVSMGVYRVFLIAFGLTALIMALVEFVIVFLSFIDKRRFFLYPEYEAIELRDRMKKRSEAFLGSKIKSTIYDKETKLYRSLGMVFKDAEQPVDIIILIIFAAFFFWIIPVGVNIYLFAYLFWLLILPLTLILVRRRSANNVV